MLARNLPHLGDLGLVLVPPDRSHRSVGLLAASVLSGAGRRIVVPEPQHQRRWPAGPVVVYSPRMWPVIITVVVIVPLLVLAWTRVRRR